MWKSDAKSYDIENTCIAPFPFIAEIYPRSQGSASTCVYLYVYHMWIRAGREKII